MTDSSILFNEIHTAGRHRLGVATLNVPTALNALSIDMVRLLTPRLRAWAADSGIAAVMLDGAGDRAFCAGGDLRQLHQSMREVGAGRNLYAESFFSEEYELDHLIHTYPKPVMVWGHGIVMGGGVGLMAGASHRVVTEGTQLAMPEIGIGLFPDVGAGWFLQRMPGRAGLFLALTAAPLNAGDALYCGMADVFVPHDLKRQMLGLIAASTWEGDKATDGAALSAILAALGACALPPESQVQGHADVIEQLVADDDLAAIASALREVHDDAPWLQVAAKAFAKGSPTSLALTLALWQRAKGLSLADVFRLEYRAALGCCAHADFSEGIRAMLVDKDRRPRWTPSTLEQVGPDSLDDHLRLRGEMPQRLAQLD